MSDRKWQIASGLFCSVMLVTQVVLSAGEFREDFTKPTQGWSGGDVVSSLGHGDETSIKVTCKKGEKIESPEIVLDGTADIVWLDMWVHTPESETGLIIELMNSGYLCSMGLDKFSARSRQNYGVRVSRAWDHSGWPRFYEVTGNLYTGEDWTAKPSTWVRLTARIDMKHKLFDVYRDGRLAFCELEMSRRANDSRKVMLRFTPGVDKKGSAVFFFDDIYLGTKKPAGIEEPAFYPEKPAGLICRIVVVGDTQISNGMKLANIFSQMGTVVPVINKLQPDGIFFVGDLIALKERKPDEYAAICKDKYAAWKKQASELKAPYYPIRGNHDPLPYYADMVKKEIDYVVEIKGQTFICYSSANPDNVDGWNHQGAISASQLEWMEAEMKKAKEKGNRIFVMTHITSMTNTSPLVGWYVRKGQKELHALYKEYGVVMEVSGHMHRWLVNKEIDGVMYVVAPTVMEGGGMLIGHGILVMDILSDKILQYEKIVKGSYLKDWGKWAENEIPLNH